MVFRIEHPSLAAVVVGLGVGLLCLALMPQIERLQEVDLLLFERLSGHPDAVLGEGLEKSPRMIEQFAEAAAGAPAELLFLDENEGKYFESMPPPPSDLAVVLARLHKHGVEAFGIGYPLQWEDPDSLALETLRLVMDRFEGAVLGFPLKDSTVPQPVAAPFQLASLPYAGIGGDGSKLPVVSGIHGVAPELGGSRTLAGFTRLENEKAEPQRAYLLARWDDRVIFSLPLVVEIARRGLAIEEVRVVLGREIRLGAEGPKIAIDFRGRVDLEEGTPSLISAPATALISGEFPEGFWAPGAAVFFTDEQILSPREEREWTAQLPRIEQLIRSAPQRVGLLAVPRPNPLLELGGLIGLALVCGWLLRSDSGLLRLFSSALMMAIVAGALALMIYFERGSPLPLAFLSVPVAAWLGGEFARLTRWVGVVSSDQSGRDDEAMAEAPKKRGRRKRRKGKQQ